MKIFKYLKSIFLPLLAVIYPIVFLYNYNAQYLEIVDLGLPLLFALLIGVIVFGLFLLFQRKALSASVSAVVFFVFFYSYGSLFQFLLKHNIFIVEHFLLLPLIIVAACYAGYFLTFLKPKILTPIQNALFLLLFALISFNIVTAVPMEIKKAQARNVRQQVVQAASTASTKYPDIYYIVIDEYAGFDAVEEYWHSNHLNEFGEFLEKNDFFVARKSRSFSITTVQEMSSRLNLKRFPNDKTHFDLLKEMADGKVWQWVKPYGYTTVVFNPLFNTYFHVDHEIRYDSEVLGKVEVGADNFDQMILDQTMFTVFANYYKARDPELIKVRNMTMYSLKNTANPPGVKSPKLVYSHLTITHAPHIFNEFGGPLDPRYKLDWNYYLGLHKYATKELQKLVEEIFISADPENPPIIILQSDHGARNLKLPMAGSVILEDYPEKYQKSILNALYLPGYDYTQLPDDLDPILTFEIVLNHYLDAGVSVDIRGEVE